MTVQCESAQAEPFWIPGAGLGLGKDSGRATFDIFWASQNRGTFAGIEGLKHTCRTLGRLEFKRYRRDI